MSESIEQLKDAIDSEVEREKLLAQAAVIIEISKEIREHNYITVSQINGSLMSRIEVIHDKLYRELTDA